MPTPVSSYGVPRTRTPALTGVFDQMTPPRGVQITGTTRDSSGNALGNCTVQIFETLTELFRGQTTSDSTGKFAVNVNNDRPFFLVAYLAGSGDVAGTTVDSLISPAFVAVTNTYNSLTLATLSAAERIPFGAIQLVVETWAAGAGGKSGSPLQGGGAGAYAKKTILISPFDWGNTIGYSLGPVSEPDSNGSASTIGPQSTSVWTLNLSAGGGVSDGTGGTASGGDVNTSGGNNSAGTGGDSPNGGTGGTSGGGIGGAGNSPGGGGGGGTVAGNSGGAGRGKFAWT